MRSRLKEQPPVEWMRLSRAVAMAVFQDEGHGLLLPAGAETFRIRWGVFPFDCEPEQFPLIRVLLTRAALKTCQPQSAVLAENDESEGQRILREFAFGNPLINEECGPQVERRLELLAAADEIEARDKRPLVEVAEELASDLNAWREEHRRIQKLLKSTTEQFAEAVRHGHLPVRANEALGTQFDEWSRRHVVYRASLPDELFGASCILDPLLASQDRLMFVTGSTPELAVAGRRFLDVEIDRASLRRLWPISQQSQQDAADLAARMLAMLQAAQPRLKRDTALAKLQRDAPCTYRQALAAWEAAPPELRGTRARS